MTATSTIRRTTVAEPRADFDTDVDTKRTDDDVDYSGWYCVKTRPWPCPGVGCDFVALYMTAAHLIIVWPEQDDSSLLANAHNAKLVGRDPKIVEYQPDFGRCIAYDEWRRLGSPIHGKAPEPDGWGDNAKGKL